MSFLEKDKSSTPSISRSETRSPTDSSHNENDSISDSISHLVKTDQTCNTKVARPYIQGLSATWSGKPPKVPQPEQAQFMFKIVGSGLREIIKLSKGDLMSLKYVVDSSSISSLSQGKLYEVEKQIKSAERYLKKLEFHLSKLEELQEKYEVQGKMRDGIRCMTNAYILSRGKQRESALHNVHTGYKECNELLCSYESKLEMMMGTFLFEMIGIQGFARLCSGDVFEIIIKHGDQKWKSRGHIFKNNKQSWENRKILFKALFKEPLYIKAVEVRGLGKNVLLGNKYCETRDLFSAHPQQMTVNLNPSGSLKLNLVITWNPVHGISDEIPMLNTRPSSFGSQSMLNRSTEINSSVKGAHGFGESCEGSNKELLQHMFDPHPHNDFCMNMENNRHFIGSQNSFTGTHLTSDTLDTCHLDSVHVPNLVYRTPAFKQVNDCSSQIWSSGQSANSSDCNSVEMASCSEYSCSNSSRLQDVLCSLLSSLESIHEQYPDLEELYDNVLQIEKLLKFQRQRSLGSDVSISIKSALGCFDFLNTAVDGEDFDTSSESMTDVKTPCSDKSFATHDLDNLEHGGNSSSPEPLSSGVEQLDIVLVVHADYSLKLIEKLCSTSPLKCLEVMALSKLREQASCFGSFLKVMRKKDKDNKAISCGEFFLENESDLKALWLRLVQADVLFSIIDQILPLLEKMITPFVSDENSNIALKVSSRILCQMLDKSAFIPETVVTVHHFKSYFGGVSQINSVTQRVAKEVYILDDLQSKQPSKLKTCFSMLKSMPFSEALFEVCCFLLDGDSNLKRSTEAFLRDLAVDAICKARVITIYLEGLESEDWKIRHVSCAALRVINAYECSEQLVYISYADENPQVRHEAKVALFNFGDTGKKLYEEYEIFTKSART